MEIHIVENVCTKITTPELKKALEFYANRLMKKKLADKLTLFVRIKSSQSDSAIPEAACTPVDDVYRPREFTIVIHENQDPEKILLYLAHEMTHVKQYAKSELRDYVRYDNILNWKGKKHNVYITGPLYSEQPWEKEAFEMEEILYNQLKELVR